MALSGDGGDELFFGYDRFQSVAKNDSLWGKPYWMRFLTRSIDKVVFNGKHFNDGLLISTPGYAHQGLHSRFSNSMINKLIPEMDRINLPKTFDLYSNKNRFPRFPVERSTDVALSFHVFRKNNVAGCENPAGAITDLDLKTAF